MVYNRGYRGGSESIYCQIKKPNDRSREHKENV